MHGWFRAVADANPISHLVEGMRAGIIGGAEGGSAGTALAIAAGLAALGPRRERAGPAGPAQEAR